MDLGQANQLACLISVFLMFYSGHVAACKIIARFNSCDSLLGNVCYLQCCNEITFVHKMC